MDLSATTLVAVCDRVGLVAFAFAGVEVGLRRRLDVFGLVVMGVIAATGGGVIRDVLLGRLPLLLAKDDYILIAVAASLVAIPLLMREQRHLRGLLAAADALGLGAFAVAGAFAAIQHDLGLPGVILLAMLTAVGGGVIRDLLANRVPMVLRTEINATAAGIGGAIAWAVEPYSAGLAALGALGVVAGLRWASRYRGIHLPVPGSGGGRPG